MQWSQVKKKIEALWAPELHMQIHFTSFRRSGGAGIGRFWIALDGHSVWQVPENMPEKLQSGFVDTHSVPLHELLRAYLHIPRDQLLSTVTENDEWGLSLLLRAADRRLGKRSLLPLLNRSDLSYSVHKILQMRFRKDVQPDK
jgi:hypothetical protein